MRAKTNHISDLESCIKCPQACNFSRFVRAINVCGDRMRPVAKSMGSAALMQSQSKALNDARVLLSSIRAPVARPTHHGTIPIRSIWL